MLTLSTSPGSNLKRTFCAFAKTSKPSATTVARDIHTAAPRALEVILAVRQELQLRIEEVDKLRKKQVERASYEADLAQRRYLHVDPANRLVADSLEVDWNGKLRALTEAQEQYEQQRRQ